MLCGLAVASISYMHHILASKKLFISTIIYDTQIYGQQHLFLYNVMQSRTGLHFLYNTHHIASEKLFISTIIYDMKYKYEALDHGRYGATSIYHSHVSILGLYPSHFIHAYGTNPTSQKNHITVGAGAHLDY